jgi:hypothetical protein
MPAAEPSPRISLAREVGITTSSLSGHLAASPKDGQFSLPQLPRIMRDELGMRVIDLNTSSLASREPGYLDRCQAAAEKAGCVFTNLKLNQRGLEMDSPDATIRKKAMDEYRRSVVAAARLGCRWVRPLPLARPPHMKHLVAACRELADYAGERGVGLLIENYGWMQGDADALPRLVKAIGRKTAASPDTGNWNSNEVRYAGLKKAFPLAVTCDFKARALGPRGEHPLYDLKRCFEIGWAAGFRGPWCLEHANKDRKKLFKELAWLRDQLRQWIKEKS